MTGRNELVAAAGAGCFATILGHPLDCIKVHMQTQPHLARSGTLATAASLLGVGGPRSFIRGLAPPLLNAVLMNTLMFTAFNEAKRALEVHTTWGSGTVGALVAGALSGLATAFLSTPMDWVKVQAQLRGSTALLVLQEVMRLQPGALMNGHVMNCLREGVFTCIYLGLYDRLRANIVDSSPASSSSLSLSPPPPLHLVGLASATTGALAWVAAYPFDSVKSVQQAQAPTTTGGKLSSSSSSSSSEAPAGQQRRATVRGALRFLLQSGGARALYRGCGASTGRAGLVTASRLVAYEAILGYCESLA